MSPWRRRTVLLSALSALSVVSTGCLGGTDVDVPTRPSGETPVRTQDPVRTDGEPTTVEAAASDDDALIDTVREAITDRADCVTGEVPVQVESERVIITTRTIVKSVDEGDIAFPSPAYHRVKEVAPRTVVLGSDTETAETDATHVPVFITAVLETGTTERLVPEMAEDC